jgi:hypothetical protein
MAIIRRKVMAKQKVDLEKAQEMLDNGLTRTMTATKLGVHHSTLIRLIDKGELFDDYFPFDEVEDTRHLAQNFEWLWEEDKLEGIIDKAYENYYVLLNRRNEDAVKIGVYVREHYGNIIEYLKVKGLTRLLEYVYMTCHVCDDVQPLTDWYKDERRPWGMYYECKQCAGNSCAKWNSKNPDKIFGYNNARREMAEALPGKYDPEVWKRIRNDYDWKCAVSHSTSVAIDHFIPVAIGHGGTYRENLIPMDKRLNAKKKHYHPEKLIKYGASEERFKQAINNLAHLNGLTTEEYESFVDWCFANRRTVDEVKRDQRHSIEIWRGAVGIQFPLPRFAN